MSDQVPRVAGPAIPVKDDIADFERLGEVLPHDEAISRPKKRIHTESLKWDDEHVFARHMAGVPPAEQVVPGVLPAPHWVLADCPVTQVTPAGV
jgi:hypothetical protein